jgi:hypothetical protein
MFDQPIVQPLSFGLIDRLLITPSLQESDEQLVVFKNASLRRLHRLKADHARNAC